MSAAIRPSHPKLTQYRGAYFLVYVLVCVDIIGRVV
jgi:hypothetical protein